MRLQHKNVPAVNFPVVLYTGDNLKEVIAFTGKHESFDKHFASWEDYEDFVRKDGKRFKLIHDNLPDEYAIPGDYIGRLNDMHFVISSHVAAQYYQVIK